MEVNSTRKQAKILRREQCDILIGGIYVNRDLLVKFVFAVY